jgi:dihydroxyacid dehydratase/phosphogluconate dehydratase
MALLLVTLRGGFDGGGIALVKNGDITIDAVKNTINLKISKSLQQDANWVQPDQVSKGVY